MPSAEPEQRLAEALRAHASGATGRGGRRPSRTASRSGGIRPLPALLITLFAGVLLGVLLALISLLTPGVLPG